MSVWWQAYLDLVAQATEAEARGDFAARDRHLRRSFVWLLDHEAEVTRLWERDPRTLAQGLAKHDVDTVGEVFRRAEHYLRVLGCDPEVN